MVRDHWRARMGGNDEAWRQVLHDGLIPGTAAAPVSVAVTTVPPVTPRQGAGTMELMQAAAPWQGETRAEQGEQVIAILGDIAERSRKLVEDFLARLPAHLERLRILDVNFRAPGSAPAR